MAPRINDGGSAFPHAPVYVGVEEGWATQSGMTLRDYFAAHAMAAMIGTAATPCMMGLDDIEPYTATAAYKMADAMLKARDGK